MEERRHRMLTNEDIAAISEAVAACMPSCALGLNAEDASIIKNHLRMWRKATSIVGSVVLTAIAAIFILIFTKGFWQHLLDGLRSAK